MQFSCNQDTFAKYLNVISRIVSSKPGLPILNNVHFETSNGKLIMTATDLEIGLKCWIGAEIKSEGKITVPAKQLSEFVNSIPAEKVDVNLEKQTFHVSTLNNAAQFNTISADDYPSVVQVGDQKPVLRLSKEDILMAVKRVAFAAAGDDIKPVLTGVRIEIKDDIVAFVASDALRLSRQIIHLSSPVMQEMSFLVPAKAMQELSYIVSAFDNGEGENTVDFYIIEDKNQIVFRFNDIDLVSRLIDGQFPEYKQIIPAGYQTKCEVKKSEFQNALKVTNIIARSVLGNKIILDVKPAENGITLSASLAEIGSNNSHFDSKIEGEGITMAFSGRFLSDFLSNVDKEDLEIEMNTPVSAGVFKIAGDEDFIHIIMPMRL